MKFECLDQKDLISGHVYLSTNGYSYLYLGTVARGSSYVNVFYTLCGHPLQKTKDNGVSFIWEAIQLEVLSKSLRSAVNSPMVECLLKRFTGRTFCPLTEFCVSSSDIESMLSSIPDMGINPSWCPLSSERNTPPTYMVAKSEIKLGQVYFCFPGCIRFEVMKKYAIDCAKGFSLFVPIYETSRGIMGICISDVDEFMKDPSSYAIKEAKTNTVYVPGRRVYSLFNELSYLLDYKVDDKTIKSLGSRMACRSCY